MVSSSTLTTQDVCVGGAIEDIVYELSGSATTISPTSITAIDLPAGLTVDTTSKTAQTQVVTITGVATGTYIVAINGETYSYSATGTDTTSTIGAGLRTAINAGTSLVGVGGSASGITLTANVAGTAFDTRVGGSVGGSNMTTAITQANVNRVIIRGTVSAVATQTAYNYTLTTTGGVSCTTAASLGGTITVQASSTLTLSSAVGTDAQVLCNNTAITDITYTVGGAATGASVVAPTAVVDGLPNGVTGSYLAGVFTITGTPSVTLTSKKVFTYSVVTTGNSGGCEEAEITGTITVQPAAEATVPSGQVSATSFTIFGTGTVANGSLDQTLCTGENLDGIRINLSGSAYTASIANLPPGMNFDAVQERQTEVLEVTASTASGTAIIYIDGVAYSYTNSTTEAVAVIAAQLTSEINSAVGVRATSVVATNTGAQITLRQTTAGVPFTASTSVTAAFTITQSVTQPNINFYRLYGQSNAVTRTTSYPYVITTNGAGTNCNATTVNGTITLLADTTLTNISGASNQVICNGTFIEDIVLTMNGATAVSQLGLPPGVNVNVVDSIQEDTITLTGDSGAVTETYSISLTRGLATTTIYSVVSTAVTSATSLATSLTLEINNGENPNIIATASGTVITISGAASGTLFSVRVLSSPTTSMVTANVTGNKQVTITGQVSTTLSGPTNYPFTITTTGDNCNPTTYSGTFEVAPLEGGIINGGVEQVLCDLSSSNILTVTGDNPNPRSGVEYTYQWQESTDGVNFTDVPANGQGATYDTQNSALTTTSYFRRNYTYTNGATSCTEASSIHKITLNNLTPGAIGPPNQVVAFGGNPSQIGSTLEATGEGDISYQWQMAYDLNPASNQPAPTYSGWIDITGETNSNYSPKNNILRTTKYRRQATSSIFYETYSISLSAANAPESYTITVNGNPYQVVAIAGSNSASIISDLQTLVNANPSVSAVVSGTNELIITSLLANNNVTVVPTTTDTAVTFGPAVDITPASISCTDQYSNEVVITVVDEIVKPAALGDATICSTSAPSNLSTTGRTVFAPRTGVLSYEWFESTDNNNFVSASGTNTNPDSYSTGTLTQTSYFKLQTTNSYDKYETSRITMSGTSSINDDYTITVGGTSYTVTSTTATLTTPAQILSAFSSLMSSDTNVIPVHFGGNYLDLVSILPGTNQTITASSSGGSSASISGPVITNTATDTISTFSDVITIIIGEPHDIILDGGLSNSLINQSVCRNDPITPLTFRPGGGATDLQFTSTLSPTNSVNGISVTDLGSGFYRIAGNLNNGVNYRIESVGTQSDRIDFTGTPKLGEIYEISINAIPYSFEVTTATVSSLVTGLAALVNADTFVTAVANTAAGNITITAVSPDLPYLIALQSLPPLQVTEVTVSGSIAATDSYTILIGDQPFTYSDPAITTANAAATALANLVNGSAVVTSTANAAVISIGGTERGIPFEVNVAYGGVYATTLNINTTRTTTETVGSLMSVTSLSNAARKQVFDTSSCQEDVVSGNFLIGADVDDPDYILANYYNPATGNSRLTQETIISDGPLYYNNSMCGTPEIDSFEICWNNRASGDASWVYYWDITPAAGIIDNATGQITYWDPTYTGTATITAAVQGCNGPGTISIPIEINQSTSLQEFVSLSGTAAVSDIFTISVNGVDASLTITPTTSNATTSAASITALINSNFGASVTATQTGSDITVTGVSSNSFTFTVSTTSTNQTITSVTVLTDALTGPSFPSEPKALDDFQSGRVDVGLPITNPASQFQPGVVYEMKVNGRAYTYTVTSTTTPQMVTDSFVSQINADTGSIVDAVDAGAISNGRRMRLTSRVIGAGLTRAEDGLGYSPWGNEFVVETRRFPSQVAVGYITNDADFYESASVEICGVESGAIPNCQIVAWNPADPNNTTRPTQFFSEVENVDYLIWSLVTLSAPGPVKTAGTIDSETGIVTWADGFYGDFYVEVIGVGCDGTQNGPRASSTYTVGINGTAATDIYSATDIPTCPVAAGATNDFDVTIIAPYTQDDVTWSTDNTEAGYINSITGVMSWTTGFFGSVTISARTNDCGAPIYSETFVIPGSPSITLVSPFGSDDNTFCDGAAMDSSNEIRYAIDGDVTGASVNPINLPSGVTQTISSSTKIVEVDISATTTLTSNELINVRIDNRDHQVTINSGTSSATAVSSLLSQLNTLINTASPLKVASASVSGTILTITGDTVGDYYSVSITQQGGSVLTFNQNVTSGALEFILSGTPVLTNDSSVPERYQYVVTTSGPACDPVSRIGFMTVTPKPRIVLTSVATSTAQEICEGSAIENITYTLSNGANSALAPTAVNFTGLPPGLDPVQIFQTNQENVISIGTSATAITSAATETYQVSIGDSSLVSYTFSAPPNSSASQVATGLAALVNANPDVTAVANTNTISVTAINPGTTFYILTTNVTNTLTMTSSNVVGTVNVVISGTPSILFDNPVTYNFSVTSTGGSCDSALATGTIKLFPNEALTRDAQVVESSFGTSTSTTLIINGAQIQEICEGETITPIRIDLGGSATNATVSGLPVGINDTFYTEQQVESITVSVSTGIVTSTNTIFIDGIGYEFISPTSATASDITTGLFGVLSGSPASQVGATATLSGTTTIILTAFQAGVPFEISPESSSSSITFTTSNLVSNTNYVTLTGTHNADITQTELYRYTIESFGSKCDSSSLSGSIQINADADLVRISPATSVQQEVCEGEVIEPIEYMLYNGATTAAANLALTDFTGLPQNLNTSITPIAQIDEITIGNAATDQTGITTETYLITVGKNNVLTDFTFTATPSSTAVQVATGLAGVISHPDLTVSSSSNTISIEGNNLGDSFFTVVTNGASNTLLMSSDTVTGTHIYTITGTPTVVIDTPGTYTFTVSTTGSTCQNASQQGTIKVNPNESLVRTVLIPENSFGTSTLTTLINNGGLSQQLCVGEDIVPIRIDVEGSATAANVSGLPPGIVATTVTERQVQTITVSVTGSTASLTTATNTISINGLPYVYASSASITAATIAQNLQGVITAAGGAVVGATATMSGTVEIVLTANTPGVPFVLSPVPSSTSASITFSISSITSNTNYLTIRGGLTSNISRSESYAYTINSSGSSCDSVLLSGVFTYNAAPTLSLITAGTDSQDLCSGTDIVDIRYKILGATGAQVNVLTNFSGLPANVYQAPIGGSVSNTIQTEELSFTGVATQTSAVVSETYSINIDGNPIVISAPVSSTINDVIGLFIPAINTDPILAPLVTASQSGTTMLVRANAAGSNFTISISQEPTLDLSLTNLIGSAEFIISGTVSSVFDVPVTYTYTVSTTGNIFGCATEATLQGTIRVVPQEELTHDNLIPENSFGTSTSTTLVPNGSLNQSLCEATAIEPIRIDIGGSATGASIPTLVGNTGLPPGVNTRIEAEAQVESVQVSVTGVLAAASNEITINGVVYTYTSAASATAADIAAGLRGEIIAAGPGTGVTATLSATTELILTANVAGTPFIVTPNPTSTSASITFTLSNVVSNTNYLVIEGQPTENVLATKTYSYEVTANGTTCLPHPSILGTITLLPDAVISLRDTGRDAQEVCNGEAIQPIIYQVFNGASSLSVSNLPPNFGFVQRDTNATSVVTVTTGVLTAQETYTLNIEGFNVSYLASIGDSQDDISTGLQNAINANVNINGRVNATASGAAVTIEALAAGAAGSYALSSVTSNTLALTTAQTIGTSELEINGNTNLATFQDLNTWTYVYTITTSNTNACNITDVSGSIKIHPSQSLSLDVTTDDDGDGFADFTGSLAQSACVNNPIDPIRINLTGGATAASVPTLSGTTGLPDGVLTNQIRTAQVAVVDITTTSNASETYTLTIDNIAYSYTTVTNTTTVSQVLSNLVNTINSATGVTEANVTATVSGTSTLVLTSKVPGDPFDLVITTPTLGGGGSLTENTAARVTNENYVVISGIPNPTTPITSLTQYTYTLTTSGTNCTPASLVGTIDLVPSSTISLTSTNPTIAQTACANDFITDIVYSIGGGATGATVTGLPSGTTAGFAAGVLTISGQLTTPVSVTTVYTYTVSTTGNTGCDETNTQGTITVVPNIVVDEAGIAALIEHITCEGADDGQIGHPTTQPLDAFITGGLTNVAQVDRVFINRDLGSVNPDPPTIGDIYTLTINGISFSHTVVGINGGLTGPAQTVTQTAQILADLVNGGAQPVTAVANTFGNGQINVTADTAGTGFSIAVSKSVPKTIRLSYSGITNGDEISLTIGGSTFTTTISGTTAAAVSAGIVSDTQASTVISATANADGTVSLVGRTTGNDYTFSTSVSGTTVVNDADISTQFESVGITANFSSNYTYSWALAGNAGFTSNNLEIIDLAPGDYSLTVGVNGSTQCQVTTSAFTIEEPSIVIGTVSQTCGGDITVNVTGSLTPSQLAGNLPILSATLYEKSLGASPSFTQVGLPQTFNSTASSTINWTLPFNNLTEGREYQVEIIDNTCGTPTSQLIGPINTSISIDESASASWATAQECIGQADGRIEIPAGVITGGSGSYLYEWRNIASNLTFNTSDLIGVLPGEYSLTVTDQLLSGCTATLVNPVEIVAAGATIAVVPANTNDTANECVNGFGQTLEVVASGGTGSYQARWEFTPATSSSTIILNNGNALRVDTSNATIQGQQPTGSAGRYDVYVYDGAISGNNCPSALETIFVTGPTSLSYASDINYTNISCAGETTGSINFSVTGGTAPYFYSLTGGTPSIQFNGAETVSNLAGGTYNLVIADSTPSSCTNSNTLTQQITIYEPTEGPLELSEGTILEIPCSGGRGSFEVGVSGGSIVPIPKPIPIAVGPSSSSSTATTASSTTSSPSTNSFQVRVVGPGSQYILNTTHDPSQNNFVIENLDIVGDYVVTVTDGNGCSQEITINVPTSAPDNLGATAIIESAVGCSADAFNDGNSGATIRITSFDKGDGEVAGYPLWERQSSVDLNAFTISLNGTVAGANLTNIGVTIDGTAVNASTTGSSTLASIQDVASNLAGKINQLPNYTATLNGSTIQVKGAIIDTVTSLTASSTTTTATLRLSVSNITQISETAWVEVPGLAGQEVASELQAGSYRAIIRDGSGCGGTLVQNATQGGSIFKIDDPQSLQFKDIEFDEITCNVTTSKLTFKLSNGTYTLIPDPSVFELTLNSNVLRSTVGGSTSFSTGTATSSLSGTSTTSTSSSTTAQVVGNTYTPNLRTNLVTIDAIPPGDYELVVKNIQTECLTVLNFTIEEPTGISYSGETEFVLDPCYDTYQDIFFDQLLIDGGTPYTNIAGETFYNLTWKIYPEDTSLPVGTVNTVSTNVVFTPSPGRYELFIRDSNGCFVQDEAGVEEPIVFTFSSELSTLLVNGTGGTTGDQVSTPVSCSIDAEDGQINIEIVNEDPSLPIAPYDISWVKLESGSTRTQQKLLLEGVSAGDSLEVYTIKLNDLPITYVTQVENEPLATVVNEFTQIIDNTSLYNAIIDVSANDSEIIITSESGANFDLEIVTRGTKLALINSSSSAPTEVALPQFNGYLNLNSLSEGVYRYTITAVNVGVCDNGAEPDQITGDIVVENENILEIREGPIVDDYLCNGQPGTLFVDVFDGNTGPLTFFYNSSPVTSEQVGTNKYIINIDNPVESAVLEIYNTANCGLSREINIGNGTPLFDFTSTNFEQSGSFLAREDVTFADLSENEYDSFEFIFGDGNQTERIERNTPDPVIHEYAISGTYYVKLRIYNDLGCVEELTKTIKIGKGYSILVPNVFTPNGDVWNNTFRPIFNGLSEVVLRVYDPQGGLLYEEEGEVGKDPEIPGVSLLGWDGSNNSVSSPYYIFTVTGKTIDEEEVFRDGTFVIIN